MSLDAEHSTINNAENGRRKFLKLVGGGVLFAAVGAGIFATTRTPTKALEPWKLAI